MLKPWLAIISQNTVKIYSETGEDRKLKEIITFDNPLGREKNRSLIRKQMGHGQKSIGRTATTHYSHEKRREPHEIVAIQFAKKIAKILEKERAQNHFLNLTIVAEPHFLGKLKAAMGPNLKKIVVKWIRKDLVKVPKSNLLPILIDLNQEAKMVKSASLKKKSLQEIPKMH